MAIQVIPLTNSPNQTFTAQLEIDGAPLSLNLGIRYNEVAGYWVLSISDLSNNLLVDSVPMLTGNYPGANILEQHRYLNIGAWYVINASNLVVKSGSETGYGEGPFGGGLYGGQLGQGGIDYPNSSNLGTDFQLWVTDTPTV